jgi:hypothetical protein
MLTEALVSILLTYNNLWLFKIIASYVDTYNIIWSYVVKSSLCLNEWVYVNIALIWIDNM